MALEDVFPIIVGRMVKAVRANCAFPRLVNNELAADLQTQGSVVNVTLSENYTATDVVPGPVPTGAPRPSPRKVPVSLDYWKKTDFALNDRELTSIADRSDFLTTEMQSAAGGLAEAINASIAAQYRGIYGTVGVAGTTPFQTSLLAAQATTQLLSVQRCPPGPRRIVLDPFAHANAIGLEVLQRVDASGSNITLREAQVGRALGFDWAEDQQIPTHTTAAAGVILIDLLGGYPAGATTIHVDGASVAPGVGDVFTIAGHPGQYVVLSASALVGTDSDLTIAPALRAPVADNAALTFVASHVVNLAFHQDAFAFASRPVEQLMIPGAMFMTLLDDVSSLAITVEIRREHFQTAFYLSCLWGTRLIDARKAVRIMG